MGTERRWALSAAANLERAHVLGWCIELVQAAFLVADDMMDASVTRRGGPCWYKLPEVDTIAINDSFLLLSFTFRLLLKYCQGIPEYTHLLNLYNEVIWMTELGQLLGRHTTWRWRRPTDGRRTRWSARGWCHVPTSTHC